MNMGERPISKIPSAKRKNSEKDIYFVGRHPSLLQITTIATTVREMMLKTEIITTMIFRTIIRPC